MRPLGAPADVVVRGLLILGQHGATHLHAVPTALVVEGMTPEQLEDFPADAAADLEALGWIRRNDLGRRWAITIR